MTPKIDYKLLGEAAFFYQSKDYAYTEVPWFVTEEAIRATLPEPYLFLELGIRNEEDNSVLHPYGYDNCLIGSAEQGFLELNLSPGKYYGITPCFRLEKETNLFYQTGFMKLELFDNRPDSTADDLLKDALAFLRTRDKWIAASTETTADGTDIFIAGVEVGSYGEREHPDYGRWCYGTGLALPRLSVALALQQIL